MVFPRLALTVVTLLAASFLNLSLGKRHFKTKTYTAYEAAALGGIPTCCPDSPFLHCDFYFTGYEHTIPVFSLDDGLSGDHPLMTEYTKSLAWKGWSAEFSPSVKDSKTDVLAYVGSTWKNGTFLQCKETLPSWINTAGQLFISNIGNVDGSKLFARTFQRATAHQHGKHFFKNRCILLPLTQISIPTATGNLNLDFGDGNKDYPESRRCVVFRTGN